MKNKNLQPRLKKYKVKVFDKRKFNRIKNILLFAVYLTVVVIIVKFANKKTLKLVFAKNNEKTNAQVKAEPKMSLEDKLLVKYLGIQIKNNDIAKYMVKYSKIYDIDTMFLVALAKVESHFNPKAVNYNVNGSVDRGICQLNSNTFPYLSKRDFFNPEVNIKHAANLLSWCIKKSKNNNVKALAFYNAGIGNVSNKRVGETTLNYIQKILDEKEKLNIGWKKYLNKFSDLFVE